MRRSGCSSLFPGRKQLLSFLTLLPSTVVVAWLVKRVDVKQKRQLTVKLIVTAMFFLQV
jgi:hypothetical protein